MAKRRKHNYVDNKKLYDEMVKYVDSYNVAKDAGKQTPPVNNYIGEVIYKIAYNLAKRPNFSGYTFKDEMIGDGIENCLMYIHNFNPVKYKNPFAYMTQIIFWAFVRRIQKEEKQQYIKYKSMVNHSVESGVPLGISPEDADSFNNKYAQLAEKYEKKKAPAKPKKKKEKGVEKFVKKD